MRIFPATLLLFIGSAATAATELDCAVLNRIVQEGSVEEQKTGTAGFDIWRTDLTLAGFESCRIRALAPEAAEGMTSSDELFCVSRQVDSDAALALASNTIRTLSVGCGRTSAYIAEGQGPADILMYDAGSGLVMSASLEMYALLSPNWRLELIQNAPKTTIIPFTLTLSIFTARQE